MNIILLATRLKQFIYHIIYIRDRSVRCLDCRWRSLYDTILHGYKNITYS